MVSLLRGKVLVRVSSLVCVAHTITPTVCSVRWCAEEPFLISVELDPELGPDSSDEWRQSPSRQRHQWNRRRSDEIRRHEERIWRSDDVHACHSTARHVGRRELHVSSESDGGGPQPDESWADGRVMWVHWSEIIYWFMSICNVAIVDRSWPSIFLCYPCIHERLVQTFELFALRWRWSELCKCIALTKGWSE